MPSTQLAREKYSLFYYFGWIYYCVIWARCGEGCSFNLFALRRGVFRNKSTKFENRDCVALQTALKEGTQWRWRKMWRVPRSACNHHTYGCAYQCTDSFRIQIGEKSHLKAFLAALEVQIARRCVNLNKLNRWAVRGRACASPALVAGALRRPHRRNRTSCREKIGGLCERTRTVRLRDVIKRWLPSIDILILLLVRHRFPFPSPQSHARDFSHLVYSQSLDIGERVCTACIAPRSSPRPFTAK